MAEGRQSRSTARREGRRPGTMPQGGLNRLIRLLWQLPIPAAPLPSDPHLSPLGINLLASALRLEHVERLSERLVLVDSTHIARHVTIDVNLKLLTEHQKLSLRADPGDPTEIWLPIARHGRHDLAPITVRNASSDSLPHLTAAEGAYVQAHGLVRLFQMFLDADPSTEEDDSPLYQLRFQLHRSRWLIESAIVHLVERGDIGTPLLRTDPTETMTDAASIRHTAEQAVKQLFTADSPFITLLDIAAGSYLLTAKVPLDRSELLLDYESPLIPARRNGRQLRAGLRDWLPLDQEFTVEYGTVIPRGVNSFHITVEVPSEIQIRRFLLMTNADTENLTTLVSDIRTVAEKFDQLRREAPKILELELQRTASQMAEFVRRRAADLMSYRAYIAERYAEFTNRSPDFPSDHGPAPQEALDAITVRRPVSSLGEFASHYEADRYRRLVPAPASGGGGNATLSRERLEELAELLDGSELAIDVFPDNDPRDNAGHAHWRRRSFGSTRSAEPVEARLFIAMADDPPSLSSSVLRLLIAVLLLIGGLAILLFPSRLGLDVLPSQIRWQPVGLSDNLIGSADALVTLLLLVPGLMLSRLDIPSRRTVLGRIRLFPTYLAYAAVAVSTALALAVSALPSDELWPPTLVALIAILILLLASAGDGIAKAVQRRALVPNRHAIPSWLIAEVRQRGRRSPRRRSAVEFTVTTAEHHAE